MRWPTWLGGPTPEPPAPPEPVYVFQLVDLPPYSYETSRCPKCTCGTIRDEYRPEGRVYNKVQPEHMRRICGDCGYTWRERCVDAEVSQS